MGSRHYLEPSISHRRQVVSQKACLRAEGHLEVNHLVWRGGGAGAWGGFYSATATGRHVGLLATPSEQRLAQVWPLWPCRNPRSGPPDRRGQSQSQSRSLGGFNPERHHSKSQENVFGRHLWSRCFFFPTNLFRVRTIFMVFTSSQCELSPQQWNFPAGRTHIKHKEGLFAYKWVWPKVFRLPDWLLRSAPKHTSGKVEIPELRNSLVFFNVVFLYQNIFVSDVLDGNHEIHSVLTHHWFVNIKHLLNVSQETASDH